MERKSRLWFPRAMRELPTTFNRDPTIEQVIWQFPDLGKSDCVCAHAGGKPADCSDDANAGADGV